MADSPTAAPGAAAASGAPGTGASGDTGASGARTSGARTSGARSPRTFSVLTLAGMVAGSVIGAGVFSLPSTFAAATGVVGALIAWAIAGGGMLTLVFVFQRLAVRKPRLDAGIFAYARAGFGPYVGFFSAVGYWASACAGSVTYWVLIGSTAGLLWPALGAGNTVVAIALSSVCVWGFCLLITRGVHQAAVLNIIVTVAKTLPLVMFVVVAALLGFHWHTFALNLWGGGAPDFSDLFGQVQQTLLITVFVFLGVEGATVYSRYAKTRRDVGRATVIGFLGVLALFVLVSILSYGVQPRGTLAGHRQPSVAGVLESIVGPWGSWLIGIGLIVSVLGAYLAWTMLSAEVLFAASRSADMPRFLERTNRRGVPWTATVMSTALVQLLLIVTLFSADAFDLMLKLCSSLSLIPYFLSAAYALKLETRAGDDAAGRSRRGLTVAIIATCYTLFLVIAGGLGYLLVAFIIYAAGTVLYVITRRERGLRVFRPAEAVLCAVAIALGIAAVVALATGALAL